MSLRWPMLLFVSLLPAIAMSAGLAASPSSEQWAVFDKPGKFITALCATDDALWIGTEDNSLWRLDLKANPAKPDAWQQFTSKDTATDHVYGLALDTSGRLWVGTVNQGVSVYNGREWRNYGVLDGCSGERVFAIAADPDAARGSVWIGTDHGLTCWSPDPSGASEPAPIERGGSTAFPFGGSAGTQRGGSITTERGGSPDLPRGTSTGPAAPLAKGTWRTYAQADGLPSQQIYAVAVTSFGRVWVGTECDGLAWADPPYDKWQPVRADAEKSGDSGEAPGLNGGTGPGLPSNLTNGLAVFKDGTTVVSTNYGLGIRRAGQLGWTS